ncbi:MAG TPA: hypothetical protein DCZ95_12620 [Verrucomicrobia bacterium]|nr:hypothetical protein [Verrucomicrobiota bacterium]
MSSPKKNEAKQDYLKRCTDAGVKDGKDKRGAFAACNAVWDSQHNAALTVTVPVELTAMPAVKLADGSEESPRGFLITAKTGKPVQRGYYALAIDMAGIRTEPKMPILRQHEAERVVGFGQAYKDGDNLYIEGEFSRVTKDALEVLQLADEGFPWQASVGIWPDQYKILESEKETETVNGYEVRGPAVIYQKSHVRETSFVALGADPDTAAIALSEDLDHGVETIERSQSMDKEQLKKEHPELFEAITSEAFQLGQTTERGRVVELLEAGADPAATLTAVKEGTGTAEAFKAFYAAEKQKRADGLRELANQATPPQGSEQPAMPSGEETADRKVARMASAMAKEKKIGISEAIHRVLAGDKKLAAEYQALTSR